MRTLPIIGALLLLVQAAAMPAAGAELEDSRIDASVERALGYLLTQQRDDGAITDRGNATAMTALAVLALSASGHQAIDPTPQGQTLRKAVAYLLRDDRQEKNGYFGGRDGSRMYGHGIITLCLAELLGMGVDADQDALLRSRVETATGLILRAQGRRKEHPHRGGWRYTPEANDSDLSVTIWQLMALRSAQNAGIDIPSSAIDRALEYLRVCFDPERGARDGHGAFAYHRGRQPSYSSAAAGLLAMQVCGAYDADEVKDTAHWLAARDPTLDEQWFFYGTYYYAQGMYQRGDPFAESAAERVAELLLPTQQDDGSWQSRDGQERDAGRVYCTAMAVMSLSVRYHYLPIYQR